MTTKSLMMKKMDMKSSQTMELSGESCEHL
jgi:hypothetical protein